MFGQIFYFQTMRKYVALFGTLFNDIHITRSDKNGVVTQLVKVPITYGPKDKMLSRVTQDPTIDRQTSIPTLPLMSFEMTSVSYDGDRKLPTIGRIAVKSNDVNKFKYQYNPVPYNFEFTLSIYVKNAEDGTKIVEQILPFFTPDWTTTVMLIPEVNEKKDIPIILNNINCEDNYDGDFKERRAIIWSLTFTLKGYIYGPVKKSGIIKFANIPMYLPSVADGQLETAVGVTPVSERITIQPGLTANGQPTTNISNTIPYDEIQVTDDFGYIIQITDYPTGNTNE